MCMNNWFIYQQLIYKSIKSYWSLHTCLMCFRPNWDGSLKGVNKIVLSKQLEGKSSCWVTQMKKLCFIFLLKYLCLLLDVLQRADVTAFTIYHYWWSLSNGRWKVFKPGCHLTAGDEHNQIMEIVSLGTMIQALAANLLRSIINLSKSMFSIFLVY